MSVAATGDARRHYRQKAIMTKKMVVPTSRGMGVGSRDLLFGEERSSNINFRVHCHRTSREWGTAALNARQRPEP